MRTTTWIIILVAAATASVHAQSLSARSNEIAVRRNKVTWATYPTIEWTTTAYDGNSANAETIDVVFRVASTSALLYASIKSDAMMGSELLKPFNVTQGLSTYSAKVPLHEGENSIVAVVQTFDGARSWSEIFITRQGAVISGNASSDKPGKGDPSLAIKRIALNGDIISVYYNITDPNASNLYAVQLYSSIDQFSQALRSVTGAVGPAVERGDRRIDFNFGPEFGYDFGKAYDERLTFELRAQPYVSFMILQAIPQKVKRGISYSLKGDVPGPVRDLSVEVLKHGEVKQRLTMNSAGPLILQLPRNARIGDDYRLRILDVRGEEFWTPEFIVVRKVPLGYVVGASAAVVTAAALIIVLQPPPPPPPRLPDPGKPD